MLKNETRVTFGDTRFIFIVVTSEKRGVQHQAQRQMTVLLL
jgi:hypothetical protein